jgi:hypothetical protein
MKKPPKPTIVVSDEVVVDSETGQLVDHAWQLTGPWGQKHYLKSVYPSMYEALKTYCREVDWPYSNIIYRKMA